MLARFPETPRNRAKKWILAGRVSVNEHIIRKPHYRLPDPGQNLRLSTRDTATLDWGATGWQIHPRVTLLYVDLALAVVNKGPGVISVPAPNCELSALSIVADFLAGRLRARGRPTAGKFLPPAYRRLEPLPVHRLDQYTSGVFCMAMNPAARRHLIEQLKAHTMKREYVAFVEGRIAAPEGTWRQMLQLSRDEMRQRVVSTQPSDPESGVREAITHYQVLAEYPLADGKSFVTKLRLRLETGRKHQIRVQAANAGLPLVGDRTYNPGLAGPAHSNLLVAFPRQALHAETLSLEHPDRPGTRLSWTAELPKDLKQLEAALRSAGREK